MGGEVGVVVVEVAKDRIDGVFVFIVEYGDGHGVF